MESMYGTRGVMIMASNSVRRTCGKRRVCNVTCSVVCCEASSLLMESM